MAGNRNMWPKDLQPGLNAHFGMSYREHPEEWRMAFDTDTSEKSFEEDVLEVGLGLASVKAEGADYAFDQGGQSWTSRYTHDTIGLAIELTKESLRDNLYVRLGQKMAKSAARSLKQTKEVRCANVFNYAVTAGYTGGDGKTLLATDHPLFSGGTASNTLATPADFSETSLEELLIQIRKCKDDRGLYTAIKAVRLVLPPDAEYEAVRVLRSANRSGTADNDTNAVRTLSVFSNQPAIMTRIIDPDAWFIKTDAPDGLKLIQRQAVETNSNTDPRNSNYIQSWDERYSQGWSDWRGCYGSMGA